jgi:hypothetical protein
MVLENVARKQLTWDRLLWTWVDIFSIRSNKAFPIWPNLQISCEEGRNYSQTEREGGRTSNLLGDLATLVDLTNFLM